MHLENKIKIIRRHTVSGVYKRSTTIFQCVYKYKFLGSVDTGFYKRDTHSKSCWLQKAQAGKDQEKVQSEKDSHSKNRGGKKLN